MNSRLATPFRALQLAIGLTATLAGLDKFFNILADWGHYVSPAVAQLLPFPVGTFMAIVGIVEIAVGVAILVAAPRIGAYAASAFSAMGPPPRVVTTLALALAVGPSAMQGVAAAPLSPAPEQQTAAATVLRQGMRKLWTDHVVWTRGYIVAAVGDQPDAAAAAARLMKNQEDIGAAVAAYYGKAAGDRLTALLKDHIAIAVDIIKFAKAGDKASQEQANTKWLRNAEDIADFLSKANPHWPRAVLVKMMNMHLSTTTDEVVARLTKNWDADTRAFDAVYEHILAMADALSDGIIKQFPEKFAGKS